ncbi:MAG TPA: heme exporter protein CcmB [Candidatus Binatus sp.]|jgi:heme exporter protein B|nr:heme exporter protein CcmB [Candidatus Binatus sp.]
MRGALVIFRKDLSIEWRTREGLSSVLVLGLLLLVVLTVAHDAPPEAAPALAPSVLWATFLFTGLLGVQRGFLLERENDCLAGLLVSPVDPAAIYVGKLGANVALLAIMQLFVVPLVGLFLHLDLMPVLPALLVVLALGNFGFAALATLFAAISVRVRAREVMLPLLLLPLLVPLLIGTVSATRSVLAGGLALATDAVTVLVAFDVIFAVAGWLLFAYVVRD